LLISYLFIYTNALKQKCLKTLITFTSQPLMVSMQHMPRDRTDHKGRISGWFLVANWFSDCNSKKQNSANITCEILPLAQSAPLKSWYSSHLSHLYFILSILFSFRFYSCSSTNHTSTSYLVRSYKCFLSIVLHREGIN
jgi:hypothetical protein